MIFLAYDHVCHYHVHKIREPALELKLLKGAQAAFCTFGTKAYSNICPYSSHSYQYYLSFLYSTGWHYSVLVKPCYTWDAGLMANGY